MKFTFGSVCSGIEAASVAWGDFAKPLWFSEIEPFPCAVLAHHYPNIPNLGDMRTIAKRILDREIFAPDVLVGGTPCQAFSIAGKRESLNDERGNLTLVLIEILEAIDSVRKEDGKNPCVLVWENVPGVLSAKDNAFGYLLGGLVGEFEPLQPPRGKWTGAGYVHSEKRNIAWRILNAKHFGVPQSRRRIFLVASSGSLSSAEVLFEPFGKRIPCTPRAEAVAPTLTASRGRRFNDSEVIIREERGLRWLTPNECERLMGFPPGYTRIPYRNKQKENCPDSHRYKAIGNSMAVPVMRWIGKRLFTTGN